MNLLETFQKVQTMPPGYPPAGISYNRTFYNENLSPAIPLAAARGGFRNATEEAINHPGYIAYHGDAITASQHIRINQPNKLAGVSANARNY